MPKNAIVVGMPRSGTSMVTNIFAKCGYFAADEGSNQLRGGDEFNPSGYWEAQDLIDANVEVFKRVGYSEHNTWTKKAITYHQAGQITQLPHAEQHVQLVKRYDSHRPWVWKDPRLCYTIGYWWPLIDHNTTRVIFLKRDPVQIYNSFRRLNWRDSGREAREDVMLRIENHLSCAAKSIDQFNIPHIEINYSDFSVKPVEIAEKIGQFFELSLKTDDLGFDKKLNTSGFRGSLMKAAVKIASLLPDGLKNIIKTLIPQFLLKIIFPHRYPK